ncbi:MAG: pyridoxamine 5'-phosphate oxidase family protein [Candidatus Dojkabacteria bacterium]|jgi:hypothetical protein|nr:pyridoxamine 5'-phosphate oxidase family protein [Candidatus Dojkabacteria bacterium]
MATNPNLLAASILRDNIYITIATSNKKSDPWVSPLFTAYDRNLSFYWISPKDAVHSQNIRDNEKIAIVCFDSHAPKWEGVGVYLSAVAYRVINPIEIVKGLKLIFKRLNEKLPPVKNFRGKFGYRLYCAKPQDISITTYKVVNDEEVDARKALSLSKVKKELNRK